MPTNTNVNSNTDKKEVVYDKEVARFAKRIAVAYNSDKIRLVTSRNVRRAVLLHDIDAINDVIKDIPNMPDGFRSDFCDAFIGEDMSGLELATPAILGYAYRTISARVQNGDKSQQVRLNKLAKRIDDLSADFANSGGMVVRQHEWPLINMSNIANENEDFAIMLDARMADVADAKKDEMMANSDYAKKIAEDYDDAWGLRNVKTEDVDRLSERWDEIYKVLYRSEIWDATLEKMAKCKMLDSKGNIIPQFRGGRGDTAEYEEYKPGFRILDDSRYESIVELVEHDIAKKYVANFDAKIDKDAIESELNETLLIKLYEIYAADQIASGAMNTPEQFADSEFREKFEKMLEPEGDGIQISDRGYNAAIETQTDATVGWGARLRNKIGGTSKALERFWKKVNRSLEYVDDMADVRMSRAAIARRKKRRDLAGRVITGFSSSFIASALITTIATAAAAKMGLTLASGLALVGGGAALGIMGFQVARWIRNQKKKHLPITWEEFKENKHLLRSLGTSGLAIVAMVLGIKGWAEAAMGVGIGAVALGAYNNGRRMFQSMQDSEMSQRQKIAWTIASVASVILGALGGRMGAQWGIEQYNELNPDNMLFQNKEMIPGEPKKVSDEIVRERTVRHYPDEMLQSAKSAVEGWYAHDYPNHPEILQQDIDAVNQYNIDHDTNLDPYRILRAMKISQPSRLAYTPAWSDTYNVPQELISQAAHAVGGGGYDPAGMEAAKFLDANYLGKSGNVGDVPMGHTVNKTYSPITELPTETTETVIDQPARYEPTFDAKPEPVDVRAGYGAFGNYPQRDRAPVKTSVGDKFALFLDRVRDRRLDEKSNLRDRVGSFLDRVRGNRRNEPVTEDVPPVIDNEEEKIPTFTMDDPQEQQLPPVILGERNEELRPTGANTQSPARREFMVPPISSKKLFPEPLFKDIKKPGIEPSRVQEPVQPVQSGLENMPVALTIPEIREYEPYYDFALTEAQAERWNNLNKQLATIRAEMKSPFTRADKFLKLRKQAKHLTDEINSFTAELGNPSAFEIEQALTEIERRKKLKDLIAQYNRHMAKKPSGDSVSDWRSLKWEEELSKLVDKIDALGGWNSLDESKLRFATPKPGRLEQKLAEIAWRDTDRQQQPQRVFEMPMREEQPEERRPFEPERKERDADIWAKRFEFEHQKPDFENRYPRDKHLDLRNRAMPQPVLKSAMRQNLVSYQLMEIRGVPVKLLYLDGQPNPIIKNGGHSMVIVDVNGLRIPFFRANGDEGNALFKNGAWYPAFEFRKDETNKAKLYINVKAYGYNSKELTKIAEELGNRLEDLEGNDMSVFDYDTINKILYHGTDDSNSSLWAPSGSKIYTTPNNVANYLRKVKAPGYNPFANAVSGISNRVAGGFFNRRNVSNEHK